MRVRSNPTGARTIEELRLTELTDEDGALRLRVEPGPSMRWLEQGFFMGIGFICANLIVAAIIGIIALIVIR